MTDSRQSKPSKARPLLDVARKARSVAQSRTAPPARNGGGSTLRSSQRNDDALTAWWRRHRFLLVFMAVNVFCLAASRALFGVALALDILVGLPLLYSVRKGYWSDENNRQN
jgi:hypothetical protein